MLKLLRVFLSLSKPLAPGNGGIFFNINCKDLIYV